MSPTLISVTNLLPTERPAQFHKTIHRQAEHGRAHFEALQERCKAQCHSKFPASVHDLRDETQWPDQNRISSSYLNNQTTIKVYKYHHWDKSHCFYRLKNNLTFSIQQKIFWLNISVHNPSLMQIFLLNTFITNDDLYTTVCCVIT